MDTMLQSKDRIFEHLGEITQALASPVRLRIVQHLLNRPSYVEEMSQFLGQPVGSISQHLQKLRQVGLVAIQKQGTSRLYSLSNPKVADVLVSLQRLGSAVDSSIRENEELISPSEVCSPLGLEEALAQVRQKKALLIDVREKEDFQKTPVAGAIAIPLADLSVRAGELAKSKTIFLFCRGPYCGLATQAVLSLRKKGFKAYRLKENSVQINHLIKEE